MVVAKAGGCGKWGQVSKRVYIFSHKIKSDGLMYGMVTTVDNNDTVLYT